MQQRYREQRYIQSIMKRGVIINRFATHPAPFSHIFRFRNRCAFAWESSLQWQSQSSSDPTLYPDRQLILGIAGRVQASTVTESEPCLLREIVAYSVSFRVRLWPIAFPTWPGWVQVVLSIGHTGRPRCRPCQCMAMAFAGTPVVTHIIII